MSKLKHTPGPWRYEQTDITVNELDIIIKTDNNIIGWIYNKNKLDARLIAAAPEMLEALLYCYKVLLYNGADYTIARNTIEKATGLKIKEVLNDNNEYA